MQTLPILVAEMRMLGIRRLDLELEPSPVSDTERPTELPPEPEEPAVPKPDGACAFGDCIAPREGLMGGAIGAKFCRVHAFQAAGVKT